MPQNNNNISEQESKYECLQCGKIVTSEDHPGDCKECDGYFHNRTIPRE